MILAKNVPIDRAHLFAGGNAADRSALVAMTTTELIDAVATRLVSLTHGGEPVSWPGLQAQILDKLAEQALERNGGNVTAAARSLGLERHRLAYRLRKGKTT